MINSGSNGQSTPLTWVKQNLFSTWHNGLLTIFSLLFLYWLGSGLIGWAFTQAQWGVIGANLRLFFVGLYPAELLWRAWTTLAIIMTLGGLSWGILTRTGVLFNRTTLMIFGILGAICVAIALPAGIQPSLLLLGMLSILIFGALIGRQVGKRIPSLANWLPLIWLLAFFVLLWLLEGGLLLRKVKIDESGLILTLFVAIASIFLSFPFGVLLALGRQSSLPAIRWLSIAYIELIRGLPLIGILFVAQVMLPLVLPANVRLERVMRAIAGFTIFAAAYLAENVRGGLQSIPRGQVEAAKALGLNTPLVLGLIVLPQALKAVIPTIVGQFISLFKDTSLLAIVGLVDLLGVSQSILANPKYLGRYGEMYLFIAAIYWVCCYSMSLASRKLEKKLGTDNR
ncbi:amine acid ABC transporter, permease protein, 3-TM region, His/Glu/Gln/Arg/opine family [Pleurocapsa sp. PCC 7327]|uniref:amino acid ABC transporter permease n=1 Tax=Pleurocapsa sp. PCC 7327 TaxID=118163 RepID=UPI00029F99DF|nr:amino acid ABC transporter permease [Pleurocapsa sp. PCC 7327]AFY79111.1 amine acid ABC transporter, permease protein, 3-TM region, His/Glu/Gln/Arg/opine family [Pleurocapsa sp. PCC 7327]